MFTDCSSSFAEGMQDEMYKTKMRSCASNNDMSVVSGVSLKSSERAPSATKGRSHYCDHLIILNIIDFFIGHHAPTIIPYFSQVGDYTMLCGTDVTFLPWDFKSIGVLNKLFLVGCLTSANITVIRRETLPVLTARTWYDMCQPLVLVIIFSLPQLYSAEPFM